MHTHRRVMARLAEWCDEAALMHWVQDAGEPPSWPEAYRRLQREGRRPKYGSIFARLGRAQRSRSSEHWGRQPLSRSPLVSDADLRAMALLVPRGMGEPARTPVDGLTLP
jgi:hypothetical protein